MIKPRIAFFVLLLIALVPAARVFAQTTEFVYQGQLQNSGNPANGNFDFEFLVFDAVANGNQVGTTLIKLNVPVSSGTFAVKLDFGDVFPGANRFIEIHVRPAGGGSYTPLTPRQQLDSVPYAIKSINAVNAINANNSALLGGIAPSGYIQNTISQQPSSNLNISGNATVGGNGTFNGNVGVGTPATTIPLSVVGTNPTAVVSATNSQPGIANPSTVNPPPAALKGEATSTSNSNIGVLGVGDGSAGIGVFGITNGSGSAGADAIGVFAVATSTTGTSTGLSAQISSPNGAAIEAKTSATGLIFNGKSDDLSSGNPKFFVSAAGNVGANGGISA